MAGGGQGRDCTGLKSSVRDHGLNIRVLQARDLRASVGEQFKFDPPDICSRVPHKPSLFQGRSPALAGIFYVVSLVLVSDGT